MTRTPIATVMQTENQPATCKHRASNSNQYSETENIVFANTSALVPLLYAKNPTCEFTGVNAVSEEASASLEKLINRIMSMRPVHPAST